MSLATLKSKVNQLIDKVRAYKVENAELTASNEALQSENKTLETRIDELEASIKPEQEKSVDITENSVVDVLPDENKTLSKVTVNVDVPDTGAEIENLIDNSGLEIKGETATEKVEQLIEKAQSGEFVGIKLSDFQTGGYGLPQIADARSITVSSYANQQNNVNYFNSWFANSNGNSNGGFYVNLKEVYLPDNTFAFGGNMFNCCVNLTTIHGDFSKVTHIEGNAFGNCKKLPQMPYCPNLRVIRGNAFSNCVALTEVTLPDTITNLYNTSFNGCTNIEKVVIPEGWNVSIYFHYSNKLTQESLHAMIENLADMSESTTTVYFQVGSTNIAKIDEEHIAMLNAKNWNYS